jgi:tmRNA-binding protein
MNKNKPDKKDAPRLIAENRRARYDYFIEERFEAGLVLQGGKSNRCVPERRRSPRRTSI